jgi:hypothetical protein
MTHPPRRVTGAGPHVEHRILQEDPVVVVGEDRLEEIHRERAKND